MSVYKKGQKSGEGKFNKPVKITTTPEENPDPKALDYSKTAYSDDSPALPRGRKG